MEIEAVQEFDMADKSLSAVMRRPFQGAALALLAAFGPLAWGGGAPTASQAEARTPRGPQQIAGTWDAAWQNSRGETRKGLIVLQQRGADLSARIESHGNVTATGTLHGSAFTLRGTRMGVPFTIEGRVQGKKMSGVLTAILTERRFTATRRRGK
jgi:hypothetical protein